MCGAWRVKEVVTMWRVLFAGFLFTHGLVHASYLAPEPAPAGGGPPWPFHLDRSWLLSRTGVSAEALTFAGRALVLLTVAGFGLAAIGVLLGSGWWVPVALAAAGVSSTLLVVWFHWWLPLGLFIDVGLIVALIGGWAVLDSLVP
jgi:hypothetical protein